MYMVSEKIVYCICYSFIIPKFSKCCLLLRTNNPLILLIIYLQFIEISRHCCGCWNFKIQVQSETMLCTLLSPGISRGSFCNGFHIMFWNFKIQTGGSQHPCKDWSQSFEISKSHSHEYAATSILGHWLSSLVQYLEISKWHSFEISKHHSHSIL